MASKKKMLVVGARGITGHEGGVEKFAEEFCKRASEIIDVEATCLKHDDRAHSSVRVHVTGTFGFGKTDKILYYMKAAWLCLTGRYDYVFLLGINSAALGLFTRLNPRRRPLVTVRSGSIDYLLPKWGRLAKLYFRFSEKTMRFADHVIAVSPSIQRHLSRKAIAATLVRNGITRDEGAVETQRVGALAVGRITSQKNYSVLVEAASVLGSTLVTIVGGPDKTNEIDVLSSDIVRRGLVNLRMEGALNRQEVYERLRKAAVFVNCSIHEGMSNSVLEAIQCGAPVLLSDIDANRDLQLPDVHYFDPNNGTQLADLIEQALLDPESFTVNRNLFPDWDEVVETILAKIGVSNDNDIHPVHNHEPSKAAAA
ncbi:glycosyltransferase involved in cell wall biosynthesis [Rhizobium sp. BK619]|uniref:glycosyltransferase family 4 protein n=1 Tax=Rhizobium sp. BK619 TaxID=2586989 RepID=UPI00160748D4|nr:glycosyltransferase family 4 protein [Rhizobium sp. BK619]MBB3646348.1 glycosyltransferase involved in cell wall biosynthesis [Rhizobium sp. BK619]